MNNLPARKPNRLKNYDYSQNGKYFITICSKNNLEIFSTITVGAAFCRPHNTEMGNIVESEIATLSRSYHGVSVEYYVIMPNHIHMIIDIKCTDDRRQNAAPTVSQMINQWKRAISIKIGYSIWQKSFHDHIIRNENEYRKIAEYIENNPKSWEQDCFYSKEAPILYEPQQTHE